LRCKPLENFSLGTLEKKKVLFVLAALKEIFPEKGQNFSPRHGVRGDRIYELCEVVGSRISCKQLNAHRPCRFQAGSAETCPSVLEAWSSHLTHVISGVQNARPLD
jgi:hypothetical protein